MTAPLKLHGALKATSAFSGLTEAEIALLVGAGEEESFAPGAALIAQGEASDYAMLILAGEVVVTADSPHGAIPISTLCAPALVGEMGVLAQLPRTATVRAASPVMALRIGRETLIAVAREAPSLLIDVIGRMGERLRRFNGAIGLYTHALAALERHELDSALLEELRHPIPDLVDFGHTFGRMAEQLVLRRQRDDEMASAAVIQRALLPRPAEFANLTGLDAHAEMRPARDVGGDFFDMVPLADGRVAIGVGDVCGKGVPAAVVHGHHPDPDPHQLARNAGPAGGDPESQRLHRRQQCRAVVRNASLRRFRPANRRRRVLQLRPSPRACPAL